MKRKRSKSRRPLPSEDALFVGRSPDLSDELHEKFMQSVEDFESAPSTTLARLLISDGIQLPSPDTLTEETVYDKLWEVIRAMARHKNFLCSTNHLSDLELYRQLWSDTLNSPFKIKNSPMGEAFWIIDLVSDGSAESTDIWLRYYADDFERDDWKEQWPADAIPEATNPLHDRDKHLPKHSSMLR